MKKSIFIFSFIILTLFFSFSCVLAAENNGQAIVDDIRNGVGGAESAVEDTAKDTAGAIKNGFNTLGDKTEDAMNNMNNNENNMENDFNKMRNDGNYDATRTATTNNVNTGATNSWTQNAWTWIIVAIIAVVIIALIWYYTTRNNQ